MQLLVLALSLLLSTVSACSRQPPASAKPPAVADGAAVLPSAPANRTPAPIPPPQNPGAAATPVAPQGTVPPPLTAEELWRRDIHYVKPGENHLWLKGEEGLWTVTLQLTQPGQPTRTSSAASEIKTVLQGRFSVEELRGDLGGQAYQALGIRGFDSMAQEYTAQWMDTLGTQVTFSRGTRGTDGTLVLHGTKRDILDPAGHPFRTEITAQKDNVFTKRIYDTIDGRETLVLEMTYRRR